MKNADESRGPTVLEQLERTARAPETGIALAADCYLDEEFYQLELERVLRPGWHVVARKGELPEPGDYRAIDLYGEPVLLVRNEELELRAFSGVCLHRAFQIATGSGNTKRLVCPYHRWSYDLDGRLKAAPFMDNVQGFDRDACRLPELSLEEWQGFIFVSENPNAEPLGPRMKSLDALLEPFGFRDFVVADALDFDSPWNWKVMVENFMESYHHQGPHVDTLQRTNPARGTHALDMEGPFAALENPGDPPFWVFNVFPTLLFALSRGDPPLGTWYEMQIDRHDHLHLRIHPLLPPEHASSSGVIEAYTKMLDTIHHEDIPACEGVQRGLQSRLWRPGILSHHEKPLRLFHRYLADRMTA